MVDVLKAGGAVVLTQVIEEVVGGCGDELQERLAGLADVAAGVEDFLIGRWKGIDALGPCAGEEWEGIRGEREGWELVLLQMVVDYLCVALDLAGELDDGGCEV